MFVPPCALSSVCFHTPQRFLFADSAACSIEPTADAFATVLKAQMTKADSWFASESKRTHVNPNVGAPRLTLVLPLKMPFSVG